MSDCLFCSIAKGEVEADVIHDGDRLVAFRDINPEAPVHFLVIPREHISTANELTETDNELSGRMLELASELAEEEGIAGAGYRFVINCGDDAGQEVQHLHLHVLGGRGLGWPPG